MATNRVISKSERACVALYKAVGRYVEAVGGTALMATGVQIQQWPGAKMGEFIVGVKCIGRKPPLPEKEGF